MRNDRERLLPLETQPPEVVAAIVQQPLTEEPKLETGVPAATERQDNVPYRPTILFVDPDKESSDTYIITLINRGYDVKFCTEPQEALIYAKRNNRPAISAMVIRMKMHPNAQRQENDESDLYSGKNLYQRLAQHCPDSVVVMLADHHQDRDEVFRNFPEGPKMKVLHKSFTPTHLLYQTIEGMIRTPGRRL